MSKELEALNMLKALSKIDSDNETKKQIDIAYKEIENALEENEALKSQVVGLENAYDRLADRCEKYYKALEIIKEKQVDIHWLNGCKALEEYNDCVNPWEKELTQEEYDLLKEVLL